MHQNELKTMHIYHISSGVTAEEIKSFCHSVLERCVMDVVAYEINIGLCIKENLCIPPSTLCCFI